MPTYFTIGRIIELGWMPPEGFKLSPLDQELFDEMHPASSTEKTEIEEGSYLVAPTGKKIVGILDTMTVYRDANLRWKDGAAHSYIDYMKPLHALKRKIRLFIDEDGKEWLERDLIAGERPKPKEKDYSASLKKVCEAVLAGDARPAVKQFVERMIEHIDNPEGEPQPLPEGMCLVPIKMDSPTGEKYFLGVPQELRDEAIEKMKKRAGAAMKEWAEASKRMDTINDRMPEAVVAKLKDRWLTAIESWCDVRDTLKNFGIKIELTEEVGAVP